MTSKSTASALRRQEFLHPLPTGQPNRAYIEDIIRLISIFNAHKNEAVILLRNARVEMTQGTRQDLQDSVDGRDRCWSTELMVHLLGISEPEC